MYMRAGIGNSHKLNGFGQDVDPNEVIRSGTQVLATTLPNILDRLLPPKPQPPSNQPAQPSQPIIIREQAPAQPQISSGIIVAGILGAVLFIALILVLALKK